MRSWFSGPLETVATYWRIERADGVALGFVSHDREFVSSLATRIIDMQPSGLVDFKGNYEDYLRSQGIYQ